MEDCEVDSAHGATPKLVQLNALPRQSDFLCRWSVFCLKILLYQSCLTQLSVRRKKTETSTLALCISVVLQAIKYVLQRHFFIFDP